MTKKSTWNGLKLQKNNLRFRYELKLEKRRKKENLSHHSLEKAKNNFDELMRHIKTFDEAIQKRLRMINSHWLKFMSTDLPE